MPVSSDQDDTELRRIVYRSRAVLPVTREIVSDILDTARRFNAENQITGMLIYARPCFVQILEGEEAVLDPLYARIRKDERHHNVSTLINERLGQREFSDWHMGFELLDGPMPAGLLDLRSRITTEDVAAFKTMGGFQILRTFLALNARSERQSV